LLPNIVDVDLAWIFFSLFSKFMISGTKSLVKRKEYLLYAIRDGIVYFKKSNLSDNIKVCITKPELFLGRSEFKHFFERFSMSNTQSPFAHVRDSKPKLGHLTYIL